MKTDARFKNITHAIDPWHLIKGLKKKLNAKAKKKGCEIIGDYIYPNFTFRKSVFRVNNW